MCSRSTLLRERDDACGSVCTLVIRKPSKTSANVMGDPVSVLNDAYGSLLKNPVKKMTNLKIAYMRKNRIRHAFNKQPTSKMNMLKFVMVLMVVRKNFEKLMQTGMAVAGVKELKETRKIVVEMLAVVIVMGQN